MDLTSISQAAELKKQHLDIFKTKSTALFSSPGRIEIVGNHTDHNGGKVLAAAISFRTLAAVAKRDDGLVKIKSKGYPMLTVELEKLDKAASEEGTSLALIKGVARYFLDAGKKVGGFSATMISNVPNGAGVSSSSSFELAVAEIFNAFYNGGELDPIFKAKASQYAENAYFGKPCGLMDQSAIALGGVNMIDFRNFDEPVVKRADWRFDDVDIYVIATGGDHSNLTADYAAIPFEMKKVASKFSANVLAEIPYEKWQSEKDAVRTLVSARAFNRAEHFFEENRRVEEAVRAIDEGDLAGFLRVVNESGLSSRYKLENTYSPACGNKNLERALDAVSKIDGVLASRVHGGGFAGTILAFANKSDATFGRISDVFKEENVFRLSIRQTGACQVE